MSKAKVFSFPSAPAGPASSPVAEQSPAAALVRLKAIGAMLTTPGVLSPDYMDIADQLQHTLAVLLPLLESAVTQRALSRLHVDTCAVRPPATRAIGEVLQGLLSLLEEAAGSDLPVIVSSESKLPAVTLSDESLERILLCLIQNAREATSGRGTVRITARRALSRTAPAVLLQVSDEGEGISPHALDQIFEPGFSSKPGRAGVGLHTVRQLVEEVGGSVRAGSTRRRGTTIELRLPCHII